MRPINTSSLISASGVLVPGYFCGNVDYPEAPSVQTTTGWEQCLFLNAVPHTYNLYGCRLLNSPAVSAKFWLSFESQPQNLAIKIDLNLDVPPVWGKR